MEQGYLALVLHAHLPFVRHPENDTYLEERWLFEAITETYIPLLQVFDRLMFDGVDFRITMSITPTLVSMLTDELLQTRYLNHIERLIELSQQEVERTKESDDFNGLANMYLHQFSEIRDLYVQYGCNLITAFRKVQEQGYLEILTSAATHPFLPLMMTEEAVRAQIRTAVRVHTDQFGIPPKGIWLPECGFAPGIDRILKECGLQFFFVGEHAFATAEPRPVFGTLSPVLTPQQVAAFPRDPASSAQVWSSQEGYPGDYDYREYYRDIGFDLDLETIKPYIHRDGIRINTGIKYHRITGQGQHKEPYDPERAREKAAQHAGNFLFNRQQQVGHWSPRMGRKPVITAPYDAELFGHWWYEGPIFLEMLFRKIHFDQQELAAITPSEYLNLYSDYQVCSLPMSSWGRGGHADVWLRGENDWIYPALHLAEQRMIELATRFNAPDLLESRALRQAARELMLAQSSDWAFIMDSKTMVDYAVKRTKQHINRFTCLYDMLRAGTVDEMWLQAVEETDNLFPHIDYLDYRPQKDTEQVLESDNRPRVLMLAWEFPPLTIGGLSRHVYDLSRYLTLNGWEVHVVTSEVEGAPQYEVMEDVHVHRVQVRKPDGGEFIHWVLQLNLAMIETCRHLLDTGISFELIHAHDWLVCQAARALKQQYGIPLAATIHATEHGRNQGIYSDLQRYISGLEWRLTYEADRVILCSTYMQKEVETVFQLPAAKLHVIPNGVDPGMLAVQRGVGTDKEPYAIQHERIVLFVGRLVREKGVHTLLEAAPSILVDFPAVKFVVAGKGPAQQELLQLADRLGIQEKVTFTGFISDEERNRLFQLAEVAVFPSLYEPFGIVALEAMAAHTPVVVSDVGGLADVVEHGWNGLKMYANDAYSLSLQVKELLCNPEYGQRLAETALAEIGNYDWNRIAQQTIEVYQRVAGCSTMQDQTEIVCGESGNQ